MQSNANTVWDFLFQIMCDESEVHPDPATPTQRADGVALVQQMLDAGWDPQRCTPGLDWDSGSVMPFTNDMQALNIGYEEDIQAIYAVYPSARELRVLLQQVFEG